MAADRSRRLGALVAALLAALVVVCWPNVASAHTDFVGSNPENGATVTGALNVIEVSFTNPAEPANDGFVVLAADGSVVTPTSLDQTDGTVFKINFEPGLSDGNYTVNWSVRAGDAHPIDGTFAFTVTGAPPPTTPPTTPATTPGTTPGTTPATSPATTPAVNPQATVPADTTVPADSAVGPVTTTVAASGHSGATAGRIGSFLTFSGTIIALGILVALAFVVRVNRDELRALITWAQLGGLAIATGGLVEMANLRDVAFGTWSDLFGHKAGVAVALKVVGGLLLMIGLRVGPEPKVIPGLDPRSADASADEIENDGDERSGRDTSLVMWVATPSAIGIVGAALVLASFWFDGHTVSRGPWVFHSAVNLVHVGAAAAWAGGLFTVALLSWMRRRSTHTGGVARMVVRFSSVATISLIAVVLAGIAMTLLITDGLGQVFSTEWGRVLSIKVVAVAIAAGIGAYNRFTLVPLVTAQPDDDAINARLRTTLTVEAAILGVVVILSAVLVAAAI